MFARLLITLSCVLHVGVSYARAEAAVAPARQVDVYLSAGRNQPNPPLQEMKREVTALLYSAGYKVSWRKGGDNFTTEHPLIVVELRGSCQAPAPGTSVEPIAKGMSLASSAVSGGSVRPFSWLECSALNRLLATSLSTQAAPRQNQLLGRAMGRVLAHELLHYLTNNQGHDTEGIGKPSFSAKDVLAEHFEFGEASLEKFREGTDDADAAGDAVGR